MIISVISVRSPHQAGIHVVESNNSLFPIISIIGVESTCRNFRPPFIGTFGRHSMELSAAVHRNFPPPFAGTFGRRSSELSAAICWNFRPPFIGTFSRHSSKLSGAVHLNFRPPFIWTFGRHSSQPSVSNWRNLFTFGGRSSELLGAIHRNFRPPFAGTFDRHSYPSGYLEAVGTAIAGRKYQRLSDRAGRIWTHDGRAWTRFAFRIQQSFADVDRQIAGGRSQGRFVSAGRANVRSDPRWRTNATAPF